MKKALLAGACLVVLLLLTVMFTIPKQQKNAEGGAETMLNGLGIYSPYLKGFAVDKHFFDEQEKAAKIILKNGEDVLRVKAISGVDRKSADVLVEEEKVTIKALYGAALSPYPGQISNQIVCTEKFMPRFNTSQTEDYYSYVSLFATDRLTYGACSEDLVKYNAVLAWMYCEEKKTLYQFEHFSPIKPNLDLVTVTSFKCKQKLES